MLNHLRGPAIGMFANDDLMGEAKGILLYVIVPFLIGILLVRLSIFIWMSWSGFRWHKSSPLPVSVMIVTLLLPVPLIVEVMRHGVHSFQGAMTALTLAVVLAFPIPIVVGPLLLIYSVRALQESSSVLNVTVYALCAASIVVEYFYLGWVSSH